MLLTPVGVVKALPQVMYAKKIECKRVGMRQVQPRVKPSTIFKTTLWELLFSYSLSKTGVEREAFIQPEVNLHEMTYALALLEIHYLH